MQDKLTVSALQFNVKLGIIEKNLEQAIDGLKYVFDDGSWLLIRPSGTEPLMRVYVDSPSPNRARELSELGMNTVKRLMEE